MNDKYVLIDAMNLFHRAKYVTQRGDIDTRIGMALHITFNALRKSWRDLRADHVVFCLDGSSWRKHYYEDYKANRVVERLKKSKKELEDDALFLEAFNDLSDFIEKKTNATVLHSPIAEADDMIAMWIELHPQSDHIIVSSDSDFMQLLSSNVEIYNPIREIRLTRSAVYNDKNIPLQFSIKSDGKLKIGEPDVQFSPERDDWVDYATFIKCIRGDKTDNIFPAYPGARITGSRNRTGITEAFEDKNSGGFNWNNFMLQTWTDIEGKEHTVKDRYEENKLLIDLHCQPQSVREEIVESILESIEAPRKQGIGISFLQFCGRWDLQNIGKYPDEFARMLGSKYEGHLREKETEAAHS